MEKLQFKKHVLTGISFMIPVVVAGGICLGLSQIFGGIDIQPGTFAASLQDIGVAAITFTVPVIAAAIAYSIAGRPGIAPGLAAGALANAVGAGFLGGLVGGFLAGYIALMVKTYVKPPKVLQGLMPVLIIPVSSTLIVGLVFVYALGGPLAFIQSSMTDWLLSLQGESGFLLGGIIGAMRFDMGGPFAQAASAFCDAMLVEGIYAPKAASMVSGMTPPVGVAVAVFLARKKFTQAEQNAAKTAFPLGLFFITEGVFPFLATDPIRIIISCTLGSAISGSLAVVFGCLCPIPAGGIFAIPFIERPFMFILAFVIGVAVTAISLIILKPKAIENEEKEEEIDFEIKFN
ncbi:PTS fructose transporter subunit IIC [Enterococcus sp. BWT-B8]|uniref:PTS fructose transporter subunit IIC n=1 Tax=unclassified Enterococcus TaxID=2608891 RepID=UPI001E48C352|nr:MULTISPECIES: PTS fructose transporter subunit IIC [unclassified Enterococcus]MCB5951966.1 PTS fructose transporter subunit IIC [Enterococcus sp. BWT-B8]MCB5954163.1 PTS fructose transporter subunit IIC [Enterococcus sp. CWB-B31]